MADPGSPAAFAVDPLAAIDFLRRKLNVTTRHWTDIWQEAHDFAFMVAGAATDDLVADFRSAVERAITEGLTLDEFRRDFDRIVAAHGWSYHGSRGWRSKVIFETNLRTALAAGRWEEIIRLKDRRPWLRYVAVMDARTRPLHAAWHNTVLAADDPWWDTHFPPNGWNCRCTVQALSDRDLNRSGLTVSATAPASPLVAKTVKGKGVAMVPKGIDPGFAYHPGKAGLARAL